MNVLLFYFNLASAGRSLFSYVQKDNIFSIRNNYYFLCKNNFVIWLAKCPVVNHTSPLLNQKLKKYNKYLYS